MLSGSIISPDRIFGNKHPRKEVFFVSNPAFERYRYDIQQLIIIADTREYIKDTRKPIYFFKNSSTIGHDSTAPSLQIGVSEREPDPAVYGDMINYPF